MRQWCWSRCNHQREILRDFSYKEWKKARPATTQLRYQIKQLIQILGWSSVEFRRVQWDTGNDIRQSAGDVEELLDLKEDVVSLHHQQGVQERIEAYQTNAVHLHRLQR